MSEYIGRKKIETLVPQTGTMCLLEIVESWDAINIVCQSSDSLSNNPLLRDGKLPSTAAIEYAAQATALHGALLDGGLNSKPGVLAKLTEISLQTEYISVDNMPLRVSVEQLSRTSGGCKYKFVVNGSQHAVASGFLMIAFLIQF